MEHNQNAGSVPNIACPCGSNLCYWQPAPATCKKGSTWSMVRERLEGYMISFLQGFPLPRLVHFFGHHFSLHGPDVFYKETTKPQHRTKQTITRTSLKEEDIQHPSKTAFQNPWSSQYLHDDPEKFCKQWVPHVAHCND